MPATPLPFTPLSEAEIQELDDFRVEDRDGAEAMTLDTMDGFLHAMAIEPITLKPLQWLLPIGGRTEGQGVKPAMQSLDQLNRILELVMRHVNSIVVDLEDEPPDIDPRWSVREWQGNTLDQRTARLQVVRELAPWPPSPLRVVRRAPHTASREVA